MPLSRTCLDSQISGYPKNRFFAAFLLDLTRRTDRLWTVSNAKHHATLPNWTAVVPSQAISRLLVDNDNALVVFPTGGGKSLCYQASLFQDLDCTDLIFQIPALCLDHGITLVISPLISLMKDQVNSLVQRGVKAASLDSTLSADMNSWVKSEVLSGLRFCTLHLCHALSFK